MTAHRSIRPPRPGCHRRRAPALPRVVGADLRVPLVTGGSRSRYANLDYAASAPAWRRSPRTSPTRCRCLRQRAPRRRLPSQVSTALLRAARDERRRVRRRPRRRRRRLHPQHHRRAEPAGRAPCPAAPRCSCLDVEHHANLLPWQRARAPLRLPCPPRPRRGDPRRAARPRCARTPAARCSPSPARPTSPARCCRCGGSSRIAHRPAPGSLVDAAQLAPHRRVDLAATRRRLRRASPGTSSTPLRRGRAGRPPRLAGRRGARTWPAAAPCAQVDRGRRRLGAGAAPARGRHPERARRRRARRGLRRARRRRPDGARAAHERALRDRLVAAWPRSPGVTTCCGSGRRRHRPRSASSRFTVDGHDAGARRRATCPPSTASACATAGSARTRSSGTCSAPPTAAARTTPPRPCEHRHRHHPGARRPAHRGPAGPRGPLTGQRLGGLGLRCSSPINASRSRMSSGLRASDRCPDGCLGTVCRVSP